MRKKESIENSKILSVEDWERLLRLRLLDNTRKDFIKNLRSVDFRFIVTPSMEIVINGAPHHYLHKLMGLDSEDTVTEGTINNTFGEISINFKAPNYQSSSKFDELDNNYLNFKAAIRNKILEFIL
jgi:hypothetical protein